MRGARRRFRRWFVLLDGDGDLVARHLTRGPLEKLKIEMEETRPCGEYRIEERKWRDRSGLNTQD